MPQADYKRIPEEIERITEKQLVQKFDLFYKARLEFFDRFAGLYIQYLDQTCRSNTDVKEVIEKSRQLNEELNSLFDHEFSMLLGFSIKNILEPFDTDIKKFAGTLEETVTLTQDDSFFIPSKKDSLRLAIVKRIKIVSFSIFKISRKFFNTIRNVFKKAPLPIVNWKRSVPFRNIVLRHFGILYQRKVQDSFSAFMKNYTEVFLELYTFSKGADREVFNQIKKCLDIEIKEENKEAPFTPESIATLKNKFTDAFNTFRDELITAEKEENKNYVISYAAAGTIELPGGIFTDAKLQNSFDELAKKTEVIDKNTNILFLAVYEKFRFFHELVALFLLIFADYLLMMGKLSKHFIEHVLSPFRRIIGSLGESEKNIKKSGADSKEFENILRSEKKRISEALSHEFILNLMESLRFDTLQQYITEHNNELNNLFKGFSDKYSLIRQNDLAFGISKNDLNVFQPKSVFIAEVLPVYKRTLDKVLKDERKKLDTVNTEIIGISQIADYNLDTAISLLREKEDDNRRESEKVALDGILRTKNKAEEILDLLKVIRVDASEKITTADFRTIDALRKYLNVETLISIKMKTARGKVLGYVRNIFAEVIAALRSYLPEIVSFFKHSFTRTQKAIERVSTKVGLVEGTKSISAELTDFLIETDNAINRLPVVYQRLFKNEPLNDQRFFVGRITEMDSIRKSLYYWNKGLYSTICIVGEEGAGASTFINFASDLFPADAHLVRRSLTGTISTENELTGFLKELLDIPEAKTIDDIIRITLENTSKRIVIIEELEEIFLRTVTGFDNLNRLFEVFTKTNKKILWICTCGLYAWNYLIKTSHINDFFSSVILIENLSDNQIEEIIFKRHAISGYRLEFIPRKEDLKSKSLQKMPPEKKQEYLKDKYFEILNRIAKSNIALAQLFWLRSIASLSQEKIEVSLKIDQDFSFLEKLEDEKIFTLMYILIHNDLTIEEHSLLFNIPMKQSELLLLSMQDDGICIFENGRCSINLLLYRAVIELLKKRNIIH